MPESRARSRKRKAAAAARAGSRDEDKNAQSQGSCATPSSREERYVPRFGSAASKRARTTSCSQPAPHHHATAPSFEQSQCDTNTCLSKKTEISASEVGLDVYDCA